MSARRLRVLIVHNRYRSEQLSGENHVVDQESALLADAGHCVTGFERRSDDVASMSLLVKASVPLRAADATELIDASDAAIIVLSPLEVIRDHLEMVNRLNLIESDVVGYSYKLALRLSHSSGTGVMVSPVSPDRLGRRAAALPPAPGVSLGPPASLSVRRLGPRGGHHRRLV